MVEIFGIRFLDGEVADAIELLVQGAVMVVPSGPGLATIDQDPDYYRSLRKSDLALFDSSLLVLLLLFFRGMRVRKVSGLLFMREFIPALKTMEQQRLFLVDPRAEDSDINREFFNKHGIPLSAADQYVAPIYGNDVRDPELVRRLQESRPNFVLLNIGGGVQEKLAYYLKQELDYRPGIICTGAAIAFLTRRQAHIPRLADRMYLGWLFRCMHSPKDFVPRYLAAFRLLPVFLRYANKTLPD